ncbi:MAG: peptide-methionine (R)-S-oxide reductase [Acidobacteriota bacterium]|nr:peptide-methionine (R)-S-oxide reductase [Acidobacteriota bacterium]
MSNVEGAVTSSGYHVASERVVRRHLLQFDVTPNGAAEPVFRNDFWGHDEASVHVDVVSGEPPFANVKIFERGGSGPSFTRPLEAPNVREVPNYHYGTTRIEARSAHGDSHLGHVFHDAPARDGGLWHRVNCAALRLIGCRNLPAEGYGRYTNIFEDLDAEEETR